MRIIEGHLEAYWEQGWEGRIAFAFQFEGNTQPFFLKDGHVLTIYNEDGTILWNGAIKFVKRGWLDRHNLKADVWSNEKQKGVKYADWMDWFWRQPPLKARLEVFE